MPESKFFAPKDRKREMHLKKFVFAAVMTVTFACFTISYLISSKVFLNILIDHASEDSEILSRQIFHSMQLLMERDRSGQDPRNFLDTYPKTQGRNHRGLDVFRSSLVDELFGVAEAPKRDPSVDKAFADARNVVVRKGTLLLTNFPVIARPKCLVCHTNAAPGNVLGVIQVREDIAPRLASARHQLLVLFGLLSSVPILMALFIAGFINRRLATSIGNLHEQVRAVNSLDDLATLRMDDCSPGFVEITNVLNEFRYLAERVRKVAVDRDMLKFELVLLEKLIITSDFIKEWKTHCLRLTEDINRFIAIDFLYVFFDLDDELSIFWPSQPTEAHKDEAESLVLAQIKERCLAIRPTVEVQHAFPDSAATGRNLNLDELNRLQLHSKSLHLESLEIVGAVGLGAPFQEETTSYPLVIDSILTTLLNIVASTRAIEIYTQELEFHATRDPLTNLYNQRIFWELLDNEVMRAERNGHKFALLVLDLDNFKNINDSLGHPTGDIYLIEIANHIQQLLRSSDTLARYGGDEFVAILPGADEHLGHQVANRINEAVRSFSVVAPDGSMARTTVSVGYAVFPTHATRGKDLFLFADNMTYRAKTAGKNTVARPTTTDLINVLQKANEKINLILKAMEEERVVPFFQPIVGLAKGEVFGHEVLCRLETDQGLMAAGEFIDIAERFGVIARLDHLVMEKAFAKMRRENYQGMLFVNISPMCLMAEDFLTSIVTLTDQYGIAHEKIVFELTERQTISNMSMLKKFSQDIRQYGFMLAIDDFGSGYSSFSYMRNLPIDFLKIEGEFIQNIDKGENDRTVVKSIAALARKFKISVIGEYVESAAILQILQEIQVDFAQGYYTGRPMPDFYAETTAVDFNAGISPKSAGS